MKLRAPVNNYFEFNFQYHFEAGLLFCREGFESAPLRGNLEK